MPYMAEPDRTTAHGRRCKTKEQETEGATQPLSCAAMPHSLGNCCLSLSV